MKKAGYFILPIIIIAVLMPVYYIIKNENTGEYSDLNNSCHQADNAQEQEGFMDHLIHIPSVMNLDAKSNSSKDDSELNRINLDLDRDGITDYSIWLNPVEKDVSIIPAENNIKTYKFMTKESYIFAICRGQKVAGRFEIILHRMNEDSCIYFFNLESFEGEMSINAEIIALVTEDLISVKKSFYQGNQISYSTLDDSQAKHVWHNASSFIHCGSNLKENYLKVGGITRIKDLGSTVYDMARSVKDGYMIQSRDNDTVIIIKMCSSPDFKARTDGVLSSVPLMDWSDSKAVSILHALDLDRVKMLFSNGIYVKTPSNYVPGTQQSLYRTASALHLRECMKFQESGQLFKNLAVSLMYTYSEAYNQHGYIPTYPKSLWLYNDYNIGYEFYDTRFNSDTAWSLMAAYEVYKDELVMSRIKRYIHFYLYYSKAFAFRTNANSFFVPDYMDAERNNVTTLCSLNHLVSEMNVLYRYYLITGNTEVLERAHEIRDSINTSSRKWVKNDGDLWYAVTPSGDYIKDDYPLLTYHDLQAAVELMQQAGEEVPKGISFMLNSKIKWAKRKGFL
jgi:hypothetical protein